MHHPLVPALLFVLLLAGYAIAGVAVVHGGANGDVTVDGTVTGVDGDRAEGAVVLVGDAAMLEKLSPDELRSVAEDDPDDLAVVDVGSDGTFEATVPPSRAGAVVALSDDTISAVHRLGKRGATVDLTLHANRPLSVRASGASVSPGERTRMTIDLRNTGDAAVSNLSVTVAGLPDGWTVADAETGGTYHPDDRTVTWSKAAPGEGIDATLVLRVPGDAAHDDYVTSLRATSDTHPVDAGNVTVEVRPPETAGPTETNLPKGNERGTPTSTPGSDASTTVLGDDTRSPAVVPGFDVGVGVAGLAGLAVLLARRRRSR